MIEVVSPALVDRVWPQIREGMAKACEKGGNQVSEAWLHVSCRRGDMYLALLHEGGDMEPVALAAVLQEQQWLNRQVLYVLAITGHDTQEHLAEMLEWSGKTFPGCKTVVFEGRDGWSALPGVRMLRRTFEMDL
jgi:hypothetical protein